MRYVEWLPVVYEIAAGFRAPRTGRSNLYLVLLDFEDRNRGPYGIYVGMSRYSPAQRFDQHKAGIHAAGSVLKRGIEVLTGPVLHLQRIARPEALRIERQLAEALSDAGLLVEGGHSLAARRRGTFLPARRASDSPMAMACSRLRTVFPERPLLSLPLFIFFIARCTVRPAALLYFATSAASDTTHQQQYEEHDENQAQTAARVVAPSGAVRPGG
jgi:hypothetical protein